MNEFVSAEMASLADRTSLKDQLFLNYDKTLAPSGVNGTLRVNHTISDSSIVSLVIFSLLVYYCSDMSYSVFCSLVELEYKPAYSVGILVRFSLRSTRL